MEEKNNGKKKILSQTVRVPVYDYDSVGNRRQVKEIAEVTVTPDNELERYMDWKSRTGFRVLTKTKERKRYLTGNDNKESPENFNLDRVTNLELRNALLEGHLKKLPEYRARKIAEVNEQYDSEEELIGELLSGKQFQSPQELHLGRKKFIKLNKADVITIDWDKDLDK